MASKQTAGRIIVNHSKQMALFLVAGLILTATIARAQTQVWSQDGPPPRFQHTAIYDPITDVMVAFGGNTDTGTLLNDLWNLVGAFPANSKTFLTETWTQVSATGTPPTARFGHTAVYDPVSNRMMVFGGSLNTASTSCTNDFWILDSANSANATPTWIKMTASGTLPGARTGHKAVYDTTTNSMILFGGSDCAGHYYSDLWVLSGANGQSGTPRWSQLTPSTSPGARQQCGMVYDTPNNIAIIYGGDKGSISTPYGDVWTVSNANGTGGTPVWTQLNPAGKIPTARTQLSATLDPTTNRMTVFGGVKGTHIAGDTWVLVNANGLLSSSWLQLTNATAMAPLRYSHSAVYNNSVNQMIVFGGLDSFTPPQDDHVFDLSSANGIKTTH